MSSNLGDIFFEEYYGTKWDVSDPIQWAFVDDGAYYQSAQSSSFHYSELPDSALINVVRQALQDWDFALPETDLFSEAPNWESAELIIAFPTDWSVFAAEKNFTNLGGWWESVWLGKIRYQASIELNNSLNHSQLKAVSLHEIGNVLGLGDYDGLANSVQSDPIKAYFDSPQNIDIAWLNSLYVDPIDFANVPHTGNNLVNQDIEPPSLQDLSLTRYIDISSENTPLIVRAGATDNASGIRYVNIYLDETLWLGNGKSLRVFGLNGFEDSWEDGVSSRGYKISPFLNGSGEFTVEYVDVLDNKGNSYRYTYPELIDLGFNTTFTVTDLAEAGERVRYDDNAEKAFRIYKSAFDRTPDKEGLGYWIKELDSGLELHQVTNSFVISQEFKNMYGADLDNKEFINALYNNVLEREPDQVGLDYWINDMENNGMSRADVLASFSESAENIANTGPLIELGVVYQPYGDEMIG